MYKFIGGQLDSQTHNALAKFRRSHTVLSRAADISHGLPDCLSAWQRERPVVATVAAPAERRARPTGGARLAFDLPSLPPIRRHLVILAESPRPYSSSTPTPSSSPDPPTATSALKLPQPTRPPLGAAVEAFWVFHMGKFVF